MPLIVIETEQDVGNEEDKPRLTYYEGDSAFEKIFFFNVLLVELLFFFKNDVLANE